MSINLQGLTLDQVVARLASRAAVLNVFFDVGRGCALPSMTQPVISAAARVRELAVRATSFTGTSAAPPSAFVTVVAGLYTTGTSTLSMADLDTAAALPADPVPARTRVDVAIQAVGPCTSELLVALARGGAASELPPLIDPYVAAIKTVEALWRDAAAKRTHTGTTRRGPDWLSPRPGASRPDHEARWLAEEAEYEEKARRKRGVAPQALMPVTLVDCDWCGAAAGQRHDSVDCVPAGSEHLITPGPSPVQVPRTRYAGRAPRRSRRRADRPHHLGDRSEAGAPTPSSREQTVRSWSQSCASCQRPISPMGHCGC